MPTLNGWKYAILGSLFSGLLLFIGIRGLREKKLQTGGIVVTGFEAIPNSVAYILLAIFGFIGAALLLFKCP